MATRQITVFEDDLDGSHADMTVNFALEGIWYEIDLNSSNAKELRSVLHPYIKAGRRIKRSRERSTSRRGSAAP